MNFYYTNKKFKPQRAVIPENTCLTELLHILFHETQADICKASYNLTVKKEKKINISAVFSEPVTCLTVVASTTTKKLNKKEREKGIIYFGLYSIVGGSAWQ